MAWNESQRVWILDEKTYSRDARNEGYTHPSPPLSCRKVAIYIGGDRQWKAMFLVTLVTRTIHVYAFKVIFNCKEHAWIIWCYLASTFYLYIHLESSWIPHGRYICSVCLWTRLDRLYSLLGKDHRRFGKNSKFERKSNIILIHKYSNWLCALRQMICCQFFRHVHEKHSS